MKINVHILSVLLLLLISTTLQAQKLKTFENKELSLQYPDNWKPDSVKMQVTGTVKLIAKSSTTDMLTTEIVIDTEPARGRTIDDIIKAPKGSGKQSSNPLNETTQRLIIGGSDAYRTITHLSKMHVFYTRVIYKDKLYKITCFTTSDDYAAYEKDFEVILGSIRFK